MSSLRYLCLFVHSGVQHILCCVFALFVFVFVPYVASFSEMSVFIAPLVVFANVYIYNYICRLSTYNSQIADPQFSTNIKIIM
jgi:accessory gene regulator protein AgrB